MSATAPVTLVVPARQEAETIGRLLDDLSQQSMQPDEIIIVDAGSTDGTREVIEARREALPGLRCLSAPGARPGRGRNLGIEDASNEIVVMTDAGLRLPVNWVEDLATPLLREEADATFGAYSTDAQGGFDLCVELLTCCNSVEAFGERAYFPTTVSLALRRDVWREAGAFPEDLAAYEDALFFQSLFRLDLRGQLARRAVARWSMGRGVFNLLRKTWRNGRAESEAGIVTRRSIFVLGVFSISALVIAALPWFAALPIAMGLLAWRLDRLGRKNRLTFSHILHCVWPLIPLVALTILADFAHLAAFGWTQARMILSGRWKAPKVFRPVTDESPLARSLGLD